MTAEVYFKYFYLHLLVQFHHVGGVGNTTVCHL